MQPEGIDIDAGAATPLLTMARRRHYCRQGHSGCRPPLLRRCRGDLRLAVFAKFVLERHSAGGARDQFAAAHRAPTAASDLNATIADDELYALLGGDSDTDDDNGPAEGAGPAGETQTP